MKALILYFSGTGNAAFVSEIIAQELYNRGIDTDTYSIEEKAATEIKENSYDFLILGCPKYYECPTFDFERWLKKNLTISDHTIPAMMFVTQVSPMATRWNSMKKMLFRKGYCLKVTKSFPIANNMTIFDIFPPTEETRIGENIDRIRASVPNLVDDFLNGRENMEKVGVFLGMTEKLVAILAEKLLNAFGIKYSASEKCTGCSLCEKKCPRKNIKMTGDRPDFGKNCMFCMRCINKCPVNAILYNKKQCFQMRLPSDAK